MKYNTSNKSEFSYLYAEVSVASVKFIKIGVYSHKSIKGLYVAKS